MSFPILTSGQFDTTMYTPVGNIIVNHVESISLVRGAIASIGSVFGGKSSFIQTAVNNLQERSMAEFITKVKTTYANTKMVVDLNIKISDIGRSDSATFMVMTISGTCLYPKAVASYSNRNATRRVNSNKRSNTSMNQNENPITPQV